MSCSNVTDYQARRLQIRYRHFVPAKETSGGVQPELAVKAGSKVDCVHSLNGTLAAMSRIPIAIIENFQTSDGKVNVPKALQPYMHDQTII